MSAEILARLDALAAKLSTTTDQLWAVLIKQVQLEGIAHAGVAVVLVACATVFWTIGHRTLMRKWKTARRFDEDSWLAALIVGWAGALIALVAALINMYWAVYYFLNPQFYAIQMLFETIASLGGK